MLAEMDDAKAGPKIMSSDTTQLIVVPTLKELDISRDESSHWQAIARIPETVFDQIIEETKEAEKELTESMMLKVEKEIQLEYMTFHI